MDTRLRQPPQLPENGSLPAAGGEKVPAEAGRWPGLIRADEIALCDLHEREAARAETPEGAAEAYFTLGDSLHQLGRTERAIAMWERTLRLVPTHREALARCRDAWIELGRFEAAQAVIDRERATDPADAAGHALRYAEVGRLALEQPWRHELARSCAEAALALDSGCVSARMLLDAIEALRSGWKEQVRLLRARAVEERDRRVAARLYLQAAGLHATFDESAEREERVADALRRAFLLWPAMPEALEFLERRHGATEDFDGLAKAYEGLAAAATESDALVELQLRLAHLYEIRFDDRARASAALSKAAAADPARPEAVLPLIEILQDEGRWEEMAALLERHLARSTTAARQPELRLVLAELYLEQLDRAAAARTHLEAIVALGAADERSDALLEPLVIADPPALAALLGRRLERTSVPAERAALLVRMADLAPAERTVLLGRALLETPDDMGVADAFAGAGGDTRVMLAAEESCIDLTARKRLLAHAAVALEVQGRGAEALELRRRIVALDPADHDAGLALEKQLATRDDADSLEERLTLVEVEERPALLEKLAEVEEPSAAVPHLRELLEANPNDRSLAFRLVTALGAADAWTDALEVIAPFADEGDVQSLVLRGTILVDRLGRPAEGAEDLLAALASGEVIPAALATLERLLHGGVAVERIASVLAPRFAAAGDWNRHAGVLEAQLVATREPAAREALQIALAEVRERHLTDLRGAFSALSRAFAERPAPGPVADALVRLAASLGAEDELAALYRDGWDLAEGENARALAERVVGLAEARGDGALADAAWRKLLALDPDDDRALAALAESAAADGRWAEATTFLERRIALASPEARPELELQRAAWLVRQGAHGHAVEPLRAALEAGADEARVLPLLAEALATAGRQDELVEVIERQAALAREAGDESEAARLALRQAQLLEGLRRTDEAAQHYAEVLSRNPADAEALAAVEALLESPETAASAAAILEGPYEKLAAHQKLRRVFEIRVESAANGEERVRYLRRLATLAGRELRDPAGAFDALARAFRELPGDALLRSELRVAAGQGDRLEALAAVMGETADRLDGTDAVAVERELAELLEKRLGNAAAAASRLERILTLDSKNVEALRALHRLHRELGDFRRLHDDCVALAALVFDRNEKQALWREAAAVAEENLGEEALAVESLRLLAEAAPDDLSTLATLERLYESLGRRREQSEILEKLLAARPDAVATCKLAELRRDELGDVAGALALLEGRLPGCSISREFLDRWARSDRPGAAEAAAILDGVLDEPLARVALREARLDATTGAERIALLRELASIHENEAQRPEAAIECWTTILASEPQDAEAVEALARLLGKVGKLEEQVEALRRRAALASAVEEQRSWLMQAADTCAVDLEAPVLAVPILREVLSLDPAWAPALESLALALDEESERDELLQVLARYAEVLPAGSGSRLDALDRRARLLVASVRTDEAIACWSALLGESPADPRAVSGLEALLAEGAPCAEILEPIFRASGDPQRLLLVLERRLATATPEERRALHAEIVSIQEKAGPELAFMAACRAFAEGCASIEELERLARATGSFEELAELYESDAGPERLALLRRAASIHENELRNLDAAIERWRRVRDEAPEDDEALASLCRLYRIRGREAELVEALCARAALAAPDRAELLREAVSLAAEHGIPLAGGSAIAIEVLEGEPTHAGARKLLNALARTEDAGAAEAFAALDAALASTGEHAARVELREGRLAILGAGEGRHRLHDEIRSLHEEQLSQPELAFVSACRAFSEGDRSETLCGHLERLASATGSFEELASLYEEADGFLEKAAAIHETELGDAAGAIERWRSVLDEAPLHLPAIDALARLYASTGRDAARVEMLLRRAVAVDGDADRTAALAEAARTRADRLDDRAGAVALWREVRAVDADHAGAIAALAELLDPATEREELVEILALAAARAEGDARTDLLARRASLLREPADALASWAELLPDPRAIAGLEALFSVAGVAAEAARRLEPILREQGNDPVLARALDLRLAEAEGQERPAILAELARLRATLGEADAAFAATLALFAADPTAASVRDELLRLADETFSWEAVASAFENALDRLGDDPAARAIRELLAPIYLERLSRPDAAAAAWERLAADHPNDPAPLDSLERLYRATGNHRGLCSVLQRRAELVSEPEKRKDLYFEMATILEDQLGDREAAMAAYRKILAVDDADPEAFTMLSRLLGEAHEWDDLAALLERQAEGARERGLGAESREMRFRLARIRHNQLGNAAGAVELYRSVLAEQPRHPATLAALESMAGGASAADRALAADLLAPIYAEERDHRRHVQMLEHLAAVAEGPARASLHRQIAAVYEGPLSSPEMAFLAAGRALEADPDSADSLALALRTAAAAELEEELVSILATAADRTATDAGRAELLRARARLLAGDADAARAAWSKVRAVAPDDAEALRNLARLHDEAGDVEGSLEALRSLLAREEEPEARRDLLVAIAAILEERKRDAPGAISTLRRVLEIQPDDSEALLRLDRLCVAQERWIDLADVLAREEAVAGAKGDVSARLGFLLRLAQLKEGRLLDREGALVLYREVLALRPDHEAVLSRLQTLLADEPGDLEILSLLEGAHRATGDHARLTDVLEARAASTWDAEARKPILLELAKIRAEKLQRHDLAFLTLSRAYSESPGDEAIWTLLWPAANAADATDEWLALHEDAFAQSPDPRALALHVGAICERPLGDEAGAMRWYERARTHGETSARLLGALERLYRNAERWSELADVLDPLADHETDPREKVNLLFRLGRLAEERLDSADRAASAYERILAVDPKNLPALRALEPIYERAEAWPKLAANLDTQRAALPDGAAWIRLTARLAEITDTGLSDPDRSLALWREVLAKNPRHDGALKGLEAVLQRESRWTELAEHFRARLGATVDPREIASLHEKLGHLQARELGAADEAIRSFGAVLERDPRNRRALEALRDLHRSRGDHESLAAILRRLVPLQDDARAVKAVRLELAETLAGLQRREEAIENGKRVLDLEPHDLVQLQRAELLFRDLAAWPEAVRAMELQAPLLAGADVDAAVDLWNGIARIWEEQIGRREGAAAALEKILEHRLDPDAFERLRGIYRSVSDWRRYALVTERAATGAQDPAARAALLAELAEVLERRLGQRELAFARLGAAFELLPGDESLREKLFRLAADNGMHEELAMILESVADAQEEGPLAAELFLALGRLQDEKLDDAEEAEASLRRVLAIDGGHAGALESLAALFSKRGEDRALVQILEQQLDTAIEPDARRALLRRIAAVHGEKLGDGPEAIRTLERALEIDPADAPTREALAALYEKAGRHGDLASLLVRARDLAFDPSERCALQLRLAHLLETSLGDDEAAISALALALEFDGSSREAIDGLERLFTRHDRWADLLRLYDRKLEVVADPAERCRLLVKAAGIRELQFDDRRSAIGLLDDALAAEPESRPVLRELERLLEAERLHERLVEVLEHHVRVAQDPAERAELLVRLGDVHGRELRQLDAAEASYRSALELDPGSRGAVGALGTLYEQTGNWPQALEMLGREARILGSSREAVEVLHRIGRIHGEYLGDGASAERAFRQVLALEPAHLGTLRSLQSILRTRGDGEGYLQALVEEANHTLDPAEKTRLFDEVGRYHLGNGDEAGATRAFEEARRHTPDDLDAARALSELYVAQEAWDRAEAVLDVVCGKLAAGSGSESLRELSQRTYRLGTVAEKLGKSPKALASFGRAWELDPTFLSAGEGLARLLVRTGDHPQALRVYQAILIHHRDDLSDPEVAEIHWAIGDLRHKLGENDAALKSFRNALEIDPWHAESHRAVVAIAEAEGNLELAVAHRQKLLELLDGDEKHEMLVDTARMAQEKLGDAWRAIELLGEALRHRPDDVAVLERLLELHRQTRQGPKAVELLERLLEHPQVRADAQRAGRFHGLLGDLLRAEASTDPSALGRAVEQYNAALDRDWRHTSAFGSIEAILVEGSRWRELEANYVRMLQRLPKEETTRGARVLLYRTLGDLYLNGLGDPAAAAEAYKAVTALAPDDAAAALAYAELVSRRAGAEVEAVAAWRKALPLVADPLVAAQQLERLHAKRRSYDAAFVAASVVSDLLGKGGADEAGILDKLKRFARTSATGSLAEKGWREQLIHESARGPVSQILGLVREHAAALFAKDHGALQIQGRDVRIDRKRDRVDLGSGLFFVNAYNLVARALGIEAPELYKAAGVTGLTVVNTWPVAIVAGEDMFTDARSKKELYFAIARALVFTRPELAMARLFRETDLERILQAAVSLGEPRFRTTMVQSEIDAIRTRLQKTLPPAAQQALQKLAYGYARDRNRQKVRSFVEGVEITANRAGTLLAADLAVAKACIAAETGGAAILAPEVQERELICFTLSEAFLELRRTLGLAVVVQG